MWDRFQDRFTLPAAQVFEKNVSCNSKAISRKVGYDFAKLQVFCHPIEGIVGKIFRENTSAPLEQLYQPAAQVFVLYSSLLAVRVKLRQQAIKCLLSKCPFAFREWGVHIGTESGSSGITVEGEFSTMPCQLCEG